MDNHQYYISRIGEVLRDRPRGITVSELAILLDMSRNTIGKYLELMFLSGVVDIRNIGKAKIYYLSQKVPITSLISYLPDAIIQTDNRYRIQMANLTAAEMFGGGHEGLIGRNFLDILALQGMKSEIKGRILSPERPLASTFELEILIDDLPAVIWMTIADIVLHDGENGMIFILEDVTEWKRAEEERHYYQQLTRFLLEDNENRVYLMSPDERLKLVTESYAAIFSRQPEDLIGRIRSDLYPQRSARLLQEAASIATETGSPHRALIEVEEKGQAKWYDDRYYPVEDRSGKVTGIFAISRDITGFQNGGTAMALVRVLLPMLSEAVITTNPAGSVLSWNRGAEQMTGYPADELVGSSVYSIIPPDINNEYDVVRETITGEGVIDKKGLIRAKGGRKKRVFISSSKVHDQTGQLTGICLVCREQ